MCHKSACQGMFSTFKATASWFQRPTGCFASAAASVKWYTWARSTPPSLLAEALSIFDLEDIYRCFTECTSVDISDVAWQQTQLSPSRGGLGLQSLLHQQAQLSPSRGGLGLQSLLHYSSACFMASIGHSGIALGENHHLEQSIDEFNGYIAETKAICLQDILDALLRQRYLSSKIEDHQLKVLFDLSSSPANRARLSSPHASAPLCVLSPCLSSSLCPLPMPHLLSVSSPHASAPLCVLYPCLSSSLCPLPMPQVLSVSSPHASAPLCVLSPCLSSSLCPLPMLWLGFWSCQLPSRTTP